MSDPLAHLADDARFAQCNVCFRKTWALSEFDRTCQFPQPDGTRCPGLLRMVQPGCVFCGYEGPSPILTEWDWLGVGRIFVIEPINPVARGHVLVIPERHVEDALDDPILTGEVFRSAASWARTNETQVNLIANVGPDATQTVKHLHVHVVPRRKDDGLALPWHVWQDEALNEIDRLNDEALEALYGIDYEEGSRVGRAVEKLEALSRAVRRE